VKDFLKENMPKGRLEVRVRQKEKGIDPRQEKERI
jgi:hypothetical protein